eukprot:8304660-Alexandrium_andersonii.AAC.1
MKQPDPLGATGAEVHTVSKDVCCLCHFPGPVRRARAPRSMRQGALLLGPRARQDGLECST